MIQRLQEALKEAESTASNMEIDQIAWLIGNFPMGHQIREEIGDCQRIKALLPEMTPRGSETEAMLIIGHYINNDNIVGTVAEYIRKVVRP